MKKFAITIQQYKYGVTYRIRTETEVRKYYLNTTNGERVTRWVYVDKLSKDATAELLKKALAKAVEVF